MTLCIQKGLTKNRTVLFIVWTMLFCTGSGDPFTIDLRASVGYYDIVKSVRVCGVGHNCFLSTSMCIQGYLGGGTNHCYLGALLVYWGSVL